MRRVILDAGPHDAWFCGRDPRHDWAARTFAPPSRVAFVGEAILAQACQLAIKQGVSPASVLRLVEKNDWVRVSLVGETARVRGRMGLYADAPMDFADAGFARLAELHPDSMAGTAVWGSSTTLAGRSTTSPAAI